MPRTTTSHATTKPQKKDNAPPPRHIAGEVASIVASLKKLGSAKVRDEMATRYGIQLPDPSKAFGVKMAAMQKVAKGARGKDAAHNHELAAALWDTGWYEARMVACMVDEASLVTTVQMDRWVKDFDNWGIVDTVCFKLFDRVDPGLAFGKVRQWAGKKEEFVKRAAFALLACLALHDRKTGDEPFARCLPLIEKAAADDRNFVKKGVSWALRAIGSRSAGLKAAAMNLARRLEAKEGAAAWVGRDAVREMGKK